MESEFALGVVIQLLAPIIEPLTARDRERAFAGAAGLARPLFEDVPDRAAAEDRLFARFHGLHWLCARLAEERPLALLVDDAHWADEQSLRFLAYLEARIEEIPACAILTVRTGEAAAAPEALSKLIESDRLTHVRPRPLSPAAIGELVRGRLGARTGDEVCVECARTTGGNPLLARQLIAALEERVAERAGLDAGAIAAMAPRRLPDSWPPGCDDARQRLRPWRRRWRSSATMPHWPTPRRSPASTARPRRTRWTRWSKPSSCIRAFRRGSSTRSSSRRSRTRSRRRRERSCIWPPLVSWRETRLGASALPLTCWPRAPPDAWVSDGRSMC
jgi:hypothetical protein